jgi:hypothetical protein
MNMYSGGETKGPYAPQSEHAGPAGHPMGGLQFNEREVRARHTHILSVLLPSPQRGYFRPQEAGHTASPGCLIREREEKRHQCFLESFLPLPHPRLFRNCLSPVMITSYCHNSVIKIPFLLSFLS